MKAYFNLATVIWLIADTHNIWNIDSYKLKYSQSNLVKRSFFFYIDLLIELSRNRKRHPSFIKSSLLAPTQQHKSLHICILSNDRGRGTIQDDWKLGF